MLFQIILILRLVRCYPKKIQTFGKTKADSNVFSKKMTTRSLPEIGRRFANRDHTTVIHAVKTITRLSEQDDEMKKILTR